MPKIKGFKTLQTVPIASRQESLATGVLLADRYEVVRLLGQGGTGMVYLAKDREIHGELVAVKTMLPGLVSRERMKDSLVNEVHAARQLSHPNIIRIFDFCQQGDDYFITMEYIAGPSLRKWMSQRQMSLAEIFRLLERMCQGLCYAHQFMVHRDLKPENILLLPGPEEWQVKIADFGLARLKSPGTSSSGYAVGTPPYMAPEQYGGDEVDLRADIYSLGAILYELLTGKLPLGRFQSPSQARSALSPEVDALVCKALAQDPGDRYQNCAQFAKQLALPITGKTRKKTVQKQDWHRKVKNFVTAHNAVWSYHSYLTLLAEMRTDFPKLSETAIAKQIIHQKQAHLKSMALAEIKQRRLWGERLRENFTRLLASGLVREFAIQARGVATKTRWTNFLRKLDRERFLPVDKTALQKSVDFECREYHRRRRHLLSWLSRLKTARREGEYQNALDILASLRRRGIPEKSLAVLEKRLREKQRLYLCHMNSGEELLREHDWQGAFLAFQRARSLAPHATVPQQRAHMAQIEIKREKHMLVEAMRSCLCFCRKEKYDMALEVLFRVSELRSCHDRLQKFRKALELKKLHYQEERKRILAIWAREKKLCDLYGEKIDFAPLCTKVPEADFTSGISFALAAAYQADYASRHDRKREVVLNLPDETLMTMRLIPPGIFSMGSKKRVIIPTAFYMSIYPVTQRQWESVMGTPARVDKGENYPVERVFPEECQQFIENLSEISRIDCRLPSESQWEYACCCGSRQDVEFEKNLGDMAWYAANSKGRTHPVGKKRANAWGIFDMRGQVWEWCLSKEGMVLRGGNAYSLAKQCHPHIRLAATAENCLKLNGFRIIALPGRKDIAL